jgi:hypothetical protein
MNADDDVPTPGDNRPGDKGRELVSDGWRAFDETLADEPLAGDAPPEARAWLADQRTMHGLLRALHSQDAAAREGRVAAVLARIDAEAAAAPRRRWFAVAAAALLLATFGFWASLPASLPTAAAAVDRAVAELARDVARRFRVEVVRNGAGGREVARHEFELVASPGGRFRLDGRLGFGALQLGEFTVGCDGAEVWAIGGNGAFKTASPAAERDRLQQRFGDVIDLGYLDVHALVRRLPEDFALRVVGREQGRDGRSQLRIEATRQRDDARAPLRSAWLLCDEATGMVTRIEAEAGLDAGSRRFTLDYLGEQPAGLAAFGKPW